MRIDFFIAGSKESTNVNEEVGAAIHAFNNALSENNISQNRLVKLVVFYNPKGGNNILIDLKSAVNNAILVQVPVSYVAQPPQNGQNILIEAAYIHDVNVEVSHHSYSNINYAKACVHNEEHLFVSGLQDENWNSGIKNQSEFAFDALEMVLNHEGFKFSDIVRQWNYIEGIIDHKNGDQNYQIFNDVRTKYYNKNELVSRYPAATGIGVKEGGIIIEVHALKDHSSLQLAEIANPLQTDAFNYSEEVLEGKPLEGFVCKTTPKFSRAKLVVNSKQAHVLVSGTASIHGEETIGINNIEEQTKYTIENIYELIKPELLGSFNHNCVKANQSFSSVRVYVKNQIDFEVVRNICEQSFDTENIVYVEADVCRDNLLVEIEGVVNLALSV